MADYFCHIHSDLTNSGLSCEPFRIYCQIASMGDCWASVKTLSELTGINAKKIRAFIQYLEALGMITVERRDGATSVLRIAPRSAWRENPCPRWGGVKTDRGSKQTGEDCPVQTGDPCPQRTDEVYPISKSKEVTPKVGDVALSIYEAYPRKVAKPAALKAISRALKGIDAAKLLELTQAYAKSQEGADPQYIPHPATWFNQQRFNDDPPTWRRSDSVISKPAPVQTVLKAL
jgi:hypothetical protein